MWLINHNLVPAWEEALDLPCLFFRAPVCHCLNSKLNKMSARLKRGSGAPAPSDNEATPACDVQALLEDERCAAVCQLDAMVGRPVPWLLRRRRRKPAALPSFT